jgi:hypothetical protein
MMPKILRIERIRNAIIALALPMVLVILGIKGRITSVSKEETAYIVLMTLFDQANDSRKLELI